MEHKSNGVKASDNSTDLFLGPLYGEINPVINSKLRRNINSNQSESSTSILRISNTITKSIISDIMTLTTVIVSRSTTKIALASEHQSYNIQTLHGYSMVV